MTRQLNLRVTDDFAERLERLAQRLGRPMATVLEAVGTQALEAAEEDADFENASLASWEEYQLTGASVSTAELEESFDRAAKRARTVAASTEKTRLRKAKAARKSPSR